MYYRLIYSFVMSEFEWTKFYIQNGMTNFIIIFRNKIDLSKGFSIREKYGVGRLLHYSKYIRNNCLSSLDDWSRFTFQ